MASKVDIVFQAQTEEASRKINTFLSNLTQGLTQGLGLGLTNRLLDQLNQIPQRLQSAIRSGVQFNQTLEDSRLGIAAIIAQFNQRITFDDAVMHGVGMRLLHASPGSSIGKTGSMPTSLGKQCHYLLGLGEIPDSELHELGSTF